MSRRTWAVFCLCLGISLAAAGCGGSGVNGSVVDVSDGIGVTPSGGGAEDGTITPPAFDTTEICGDGVDNDGNGLSDCADLACSSTLACTPMTVSEVCGDNLDNDGNGATDCADLACYSAPVCNPVTLVEACGDGVDNDGNGDVDCHDSACSDSPGCLLKQGQGMHAVDELAKAKFQYEPTCTHCAETAFGVQKQVGPGDKERAWQVPTALDGK